MAEIIDPENSLGLVTGEEADEFDSMIREMRRADRDSEREPWK